MILKLDPQVRGWIVSSLQHKQKDKMLGREIDKGSYVLLCNDTNDAFFQRFELNEEIFFEIPLVVENKEITFNYTEYNPKPLGKVNFDATFFAFNTPPSSSVYNKPSLYFTFFNISIIESERGIVLIELAVLGI